VSLDTITRPIRLRHLSSRVVARLGETNREHVHRVVTCLNQRVRDLGSKVGVDKQSHAAGVGSSRSLTAAAANSRAAKMSARSRYG